MMWKLLFRVLGLSLEAVLPSGQLPIERGLCGGGTARGREASELQVSEVATRPDRAMPGDATAA